MGERERGREMDESLGCFLRKGKKDVIVCVWIGMKCMGKIVE